MTGLREKKKEITRKKIQVASLQLFEMVGYDKTSMEKIAAEVEIGVGTLYNYFPSKVALLFSIIEENIESYLSELEEIICSTMTLRESLQEFFNVYLKSFTIYGKKVWRDLLKEILFCEQSGFAKINEIDKNFIKQLYQLLCARMIELSVNKEEKLLMAAKALYSLLGYHIIDYVSDGLVSMEELLTSLTGQAEFIIDSLVKER